MTPKELRTRRLGAGWTHQQLATKVGVSADTVTAWEAGEAAIGCISALEQILPPLKDRRPSPAAPGHDDGSPAVDED